VLQKKMMASTQTTKQKFFLYPFPISFLTMFVVWTGRKNLRIITMELFKGRRATG
jgi:hypothetical protein